MLLGCGAGLEKCRGGMIAAKDTNRPISPNKMNKTYFSMFQLNKGRYLKQAIIKNLDTDF